MNEAAKGKELESFFIEKKNVSSRVRREREKGGGIGSCRDHATGLNLGTNRKCSTEYRD